MVTAQKRLENALAPLRQKLLQHAIYQRIETLTSLQFFMETHVFAVWDFMGLLKSLQVRLTGSGWPWLPPKDRVSSRLINELVLAEESDELGPGNYLSHFDLYRRAMKEVGANTEKIDALVSHLEQGHALLPSLEVADVPLTTRDFVLGTAELSQGGVHETAAAFLYGREDLIPEMFRKFTKSVERGLVPAHHFKLYLDRHVHIDECHHAPMGRHLLAHLCGDDAIKWAQAWAAAEKALLLRIALWDDVLSGLSYQETRDQRARSQRESQVSQASVPREPTPLSP